MDAVPSWSSVHKRVEVVDKYPDGLPQSMSRVAWIFGGDP